MVHFLFGVKKFLEVAFYPLSIFFILSFLASWYIMLARRLVLGRLLLIVAWGWLMIWSYPYLPTYLLSRLEARYPKLGSRDQILAQYPDADSTVRYIVVLGGGAYDDGDINESVLTKLPNSALHRVLEAVRLHSYFPNTKIIMSGGEVIGTEEAEVMRQVALFLGVAPEDILKENRSLDTEDQSRFIKPFVKEDKFFLVTSAWHMPRSAGLFQKQGHCFIAAPVDFITKPDDLQHGFSLVIFPSAYCLSESEMVIKEYLGIMVGVLMKRI